MTDYIGTATYSPEDNKIRIDPASRLSPELYNRVCGAGFIWVPRQKIFVAPMWTPDREDLAIELCGEIGDEDKSLVERAEERAERFEEYSEHRAEDADRAHKAVAAIADNIPLGQPILVGHHSEKHARKDAERIENGMRKAVKMWETSKYWTDRAEGAIRHAKYKERPDVRARRIKGLESDERKQNKIITESGEKLGEWRRVESDEKAKQLANYGLYISRCFPLDKYPREAPASQYEGEMSIWSALDGGVIGFEQAKVIVVRSLEGAIYWAERWLKHIENRRLYERAMLAEGGGLPTDSVAMEIGGRVLVRGEWVTITKLNKKDGRVVSVTTNARYVRVRNVEEIKEYEAPSVEQATAAQAAAKVPTLCNYPGERFATCTQAEWDAINKDYKGVMHYIPATDTADRHRVRRAIGFKLQLPPPEGKELDPHYCHANRTHHYWPVFITDAKRKDPPRPTGAPQPKLAAPARDLPDPREETIHVRGTTIPPQVVTVLQAATFTPDSIQLGPEKLERKLYEAVNKVIELAGGKWNKKRQQHVFGQDPAQMFDLEAGQIKPAGQVFEGMKAALKAGVKVVSAPQLFPTPPELARRMADEAASYCGGSLAGKRVLEPSAGTGNIIRAAMNNATGFDCGLQVVAVEIHHALVSGLEEQRRKTLDANESNFKIVSYDFLECNAGYIGAPFDVILMNPPFVNGADIKHIQHARQFLKPGGVLVAICAGGPRQKEALEPIADLWEPLPEGTFKESGTGVNTVLLTIQGPRPREAFTEDEAERIAEGVINDPEADIHDHTDDKHTVDCGQCQREVVLESGD